MRRSFFLCVMLALVSSSAYATFTETTVLDITPALPGTASAASDSHIVGD